jgi:uncharacterized surface protein with fasciclin (FAS1) repeats
MKNQILKTGQKIAQYGFMVAILLFAVACSKDEDVVETAELKSKAAPAPGDLSIAEVAISNNFEELVKALAYVDGELNTGLIDLFLNGKDQYTVFAPTDKAFFALYDFLQIDGITDLPAPLVKDVLFYHVTEGRRAANSVVPPVKARNIKTLLGKTFSVNNKGVITDTFGQKISIIAPDVSASNGIVHVIDGVLLPLEN